MQLPKISVPSYDLKIPSTGKRITYRPYLAQEEKILMMALESDDDHQMTLAVNAVVSACTDNQLDLSNVTSFDLEYLFLQMRSKAVGEISHIGIRCRHCKEKNDLDVDITKAEVKGLDGDKKDRVIKIDDDIGVMMKYPSIDALLDIASDSTLTTSYEQEFWKVVSCIESVYYGDQIVDMAGQSKLDIVQFMGSVPIKPLDEMRKFVNHLPIVSVPVQFKCHACGEDNTLEATGLATFFG